MYFANRLTGQNLWVGWVDAGGTVVATGDQKSFDPDMEVDAIDMSAGAAGMRVYKAGLKDVLMKLETFFVGGSANVGTAVLAYRMREGAEGTILWAPEGTAVGKAKWGLPALVTKYKYKMPFDDAILVNVELRPQGDFVFDGRKDAW